MTRQELIPLGERRVEEDIEQWLVEEDQKEKENERRERERQGTSTIGKSTEVSRMRSFLSSHKPSHPGANIATKDQPASNILGDINWQTSSKLFALQMELQKIFTPPSHSSLSSSSSSSSPGDVKDDEEKHMDVVNDSKQKPQLQPQPQALPHHKLAPKLASNSDSTTKPTHSDQKHPKVRRHTFILRNGVSC